MLNRKPGTLLTTRNPLINSPFNVDIRDDAGGMPPAVNLFLLLAGPNILLLDGTNFLLLE